MPPYLVGYAVRSMVSHAASSAMRKDVVLISLGEVKAQFLLRF